MLPGKYEARSLDQSGTVTVTLEGWARSRLIRERIVVFIAGYWLEYGWAPSMREVAASVDLRQPNTVKRHLEVLAAAGRIQFEPRKARSLRVVKP